MNVGWKSPTVRTKLLPLGCFVSGVLIDTDDGDAAAAGDRGGPPLPLLTLVGLFLKGLWNELEEFDIATGDCG